MPYAAEGCEGILAGGQGYNCENLAEFVMTGKVANSQGILLRILKAIGLGAGLTSGVSLISDRRG